MELKERTRVILPLGVIISCLFAALAFVRNGDVSRISSAEGTIKEHTELIHKMELDNAASHIEQANLVKTLDEVRMDVKKILEKTEEKR